MSETNLDILLVEDNPGDAHLVWMMLNEIQQIHIDMTHVTSLAKTLETLEAKSFSAILLDLSLPDAFEFIALQKILKEYPKIPIVILTGLDDESVGLQAVREGAQDYLVKGQIDSRVLIRTIRYAIERKSMQLEKERLITELEGLLKQVKTLSGLLSMCAWCKRIRDNQGNWVELESYISKNSDVDVSHGICPECAEVYLHRGG